MELLNTEWARGASQEEVLVPIYISSCIEMKQPLAGIGNHNDANYLDVNASVVSSFKCRNFQGACPNLH